MQKLRYVDDVVREIADRRPPVRTRERLDALPGLRQTLREYYRRKHVRWERVLRRGKREYLR